MKKKTLVGDRMKWRKFQCGDASDFSTMDRATDYNEQNCLQKMVKMTTKYMRTSFQNRWKCKWKSKERVFSHLPFLQSSTGRLETAVKRRGEDWKRTGCSRAKYQVQSFSMAPWERAEFASVRSKVPFAWHFLDNRSLINHWPWIRIFKGTTEAEDDGGACVRAWILCVLITHGACVNAGRNSFKAD